MHLQLAQIRAMAYYEMRMLWRQRLIPVLVTCIVVMALVEVIGWRVLTADATTIAAVEDVTMKQYANTIAWVSLFWPSVYLPLLLLSGLAVADVMPRDRRLGVDALLGSTPLSRATFFLGKLSGVWLSLLLALGLTSLMLAFLGWWLIGPYDLAQYLQVWLGGAVPIGVLHVSASLMLAAFMPSRRSAVVVCLFFGLACILWGTGLTTTTTLWGILNPARGYIFGYYWLGWLGGVNIVTVSLSEVYLSWIAGLVELVGLGLVTWWWLRAREGRG